MKVLLTYFWKTLPIGALIWLAPIWLISPNRATHLKSPKNQTQYNVVRTYEVVSENSETVQGYCRERNACARSRTSHVESQNSLFLPRKLAHLLTQYSWACVHEDPTQSNSGVNPTPRPGIKSVCQGGPTSAQSKGGCTQHRKPCCPSETKGSSAIPGGK